MEISATLEPLSQPQTTNWNRLEGLDQIQYMSVQRLQDAEYQDVPNIDRIFTSPSFYRSLSVSCISLRKGVLSGSGRVEMIDSSLHEFANTQLHLKVLTVPVFNRHNPCP